MLCYKVDIYSGIVAYWRRNYVALSATGHLGQYRRGVEGLKLILLSKKLWPYGHSFDTKNQFKLRLSTVNRS